MPFDSTGFNPPPGPPGPPRRWRPARLTLFVAFWAALLAGGPAAVLVWEAAHEADGKTACDRQPGPKAAAPDAPGVQRAGTLVQAARCDGAARRMSAPR